MQNVQHEDLTIEIKLDEYVDLRLEIQKLETESIERLCEGEKYRRRVEELEFKLSELRNEYDKMLKRIHGYELAETEEQARINIANTLGITE